MSFQALIMQFEKHSSYFIPDIDVKYETNSLGQFNPSKESIKRQKVLVPGEFVEKKIPLRFGISGNKLSLTSPIKRVFHSEEDKWRGACESENESKMSYGQLFHRRRTVEMRLQMNSGDVVGIASKPRTAWRRILIKRMFAWSFLANVRRKSLCHCWWVYGLSWHAEIYALCSRRISNYVKWADVRSAGMLIDPSASIHGPFIKVSLDPLISVSGSSIMI